MILVFNMKSTVCIVSTVSVNKFDFLFNLVLGVHALDKN